MEDLRQGFTIIELLVVITIIGVLAAAAIPQITGAICDSRGSTAEQALSSFKTAWTQCSVDKNPGKCKTLDQATYNDYLGEDAIEALNATWTGEDELNSVSYHGIGCAYNVEPGGSPGFSNAIQWTEATGNITNI